MTYDNVFSGVRISDDWAAHRARGSLGGIDFAVGVGTPIHAPTNGRLQNIPYNGTGGHTATFWHGEGGLGAGWRDQFMHLSQFVGEGSYSKGDIIGYSGGAAGSDGAGSSTGPHCHWHLIDSSGTRVNPANYWGQGGGGSPAPSGGLPQTAIDGIPGKITWTRLQTWLKRDWGYEGVIDGIPGRYTWTAFQKFLRTKGYTGPLDGIPGPYTYRALQRFSAENGYTGPIDGIPGKYTWMGIQRFANKI